VLVRIDWSARPLWLGLLRQFILNGLSPLVNLATLLAIPYDFRTHMPLTSKTLHTIQSAGAAVFAADAQLKAAVKDYATQVHAAMLQNPFDLANDSLFEEWKSVCRLSQAVGQIEAEMRKIHSAATRLQGVALTSTKALALAPPGGAESSTLEVVEQVEATDVVIKKPRKLKRKANLKARSTGPLPSNATVLLAHLVKLLNPNAFTKVNQSSIAVAISMPKGSIGASMTKLVKEGLLAHDPAQGYKLIAPYA
jgi:hypothetical protein